MFITGEFIFINRLQNRMTRMVETTVPETRSKTSKVRGRGDRIKIAKIITYHERNLCLKVKYGETKWIKGNINIIASSELSHKN